MVEEAEHYPPYDFESNVGLPGARAQGGAGGLRAERDPPALVDLHGGPVLAGRAAGARPPVRVASRTRGVRREERCMDVDLPEVHARSLDATRRIRRRRRRRPVGGHVGVRRLDGARARQPHRQRQLLGASSAGGKTIEEVGDRPRRRHARQRSAAAYDDSSHVAAAVFHEPGAMEAPCAVSYGPVPGEVYCGHRFIDVLIHGWDVAKSTGQDTTLDPELVEACWAVVEPQKDDAARQRRVRHRRRPCPTTPTARPRCSQLLGRAG